MKNEKWKMKNLCRNPLFADFFIFAEIVKLRFMGQTIRLPPRAWQSADRCLYVPALSSLARRPKKRLPPGGSWRRQMRSRLPATEGELRNSKRLQTTRYAGSFRHLLHRFPRRKNLRKCHLPPGGRLYLNRFFYLPNPVSDYPSKQNLTQTGNRKCYE